MKFPLSILDLALVVSGSNTAVALEQMLQLARRADHWGYNRFWLAEHHNMAGIASSATAVLVGQVAAMTERIRVGSGGVMLPNHAPLIVAEQFGTLATLYPNRIDLGIGRAPGTDALTTRALRRSAPGTPDDSFPHDVVELQGYLAEPSADQTVRAVPGTGTNVPVWLLGSSLFSAQLAAYLGLPFAFASHFAPEMLLQALAIYRTNFRPSSSWRRPYTMVGANVVVAPTDEEASFLFSSQQQHWLGVLRGAGGLLPLPTPTLDALWSDAERRQVASKLERSAVGGPETVRSLLRRLIEETAADELIVSCVVHDSAARLRSYELLSRLNLAE